MRPGEIGGGAVDVNLISSSQSLASVALWLDTGWNAARRKQSDGGHGQTPGLLWLGVDAAFQRCDAHNQQLEGGSNLCC